LPRLWLDVAGKVAIVNGNVPQCKLIPGMSLINHLIQYGTEIIMGKSRFPSVKFGGDKVGGADSGDSSAGDRPVVFVVANAKITY
jgi:hypothetical protein